MNIKQLLILFSALFGIFIFILMIKPSSGDIAPTTTESTTISISQGDYIISDEHDNIPNNYIKVSGLSNVYKVLNSQGEIEGYKEKISNGFVDYDINIPSYYSKKDGSDTIYEVFDNNGNVIRYSIFNGREWDICDSDGNIIFEIPKNYTRVDMANDIYSFKNKDGISYVQIIKFNDESYGWSDYNK